MTLTETQEKVIQWSTVRNILSGSKPEEQYNKLAEEVGELANGIAKSRLEVIKDSVGDALVVLTNLLAMTGRDISETQISSFRIMDPDVLDLHGIYSDSKSPHIQMLCLQASLGFMGELIFDYTIHRELREESTFSDFLYFETAVNFIYALDKISAIYGFTLEEAFESAYNEIKDRKGMLKDGSFVKYEDLSPEEQALLDKE